MLKFKFVFIFKHGWNCRSSENFQRLCVNSVQDKIEKNVDQLKEWFKINILSIVQKDPLTKEMAYY